MVRAGASAVSGTALAAALTLAACGGSALTPARLNLAIGATFTRLYAAQQRELGNPVDPATYTTASCARTGSSGAGGSTGAGDDWACAVMVFRASARPVAASLEVNLKTDGCYEADAPLAAVGPVQLPAAGGGEFTNPLAQFDGCFDS